MNHTPTPWLIGEITDTAIVDKYRRLVANTGGFSTNMDDGQHVLENKANAEFIVNAANNYEALVAALKEISVYSMPDELEETAEDEYGISPEEAIMMAYENIIWTAQRALAALTSAS